MLSGSGSTSDLSVALLLPPGLGTGGCCCPWPKAELPNSKLLLWLIVSVVRELSKHMDLWLLLFVTCVQEEEERKEEWMEGQKVN